MHDHRLRPIGSLLLLALVACKTAPDADTGLPPELTACIRTDALDEPRACTVDDDCACGAHCSFRACTFDCRTNADCDDGDVCNDLGRCAEPGARVPPLQDTPRSQVDAEPPVVAVAVSELPYQVRLIARGGPSRPARAVARGGALLWCPASEAPGPACELGPISTDGVFVRVGRPAEPAEGADPPSIEVMDEAGTLTFIGLIAGDRRDAVSFDGDAMSGRYEGTLRMGAGGGLLSSIDLPGAETTAALFRHPLAATLAIDDSLTGTLQLDDLSGSVLPSSRLTVAVRGGVVRWPALTWLSLDGTAVELMTYAADVPLAPPAGAFALDVPLSTSTLRLPGRAPLSMGTLSLNLVRAGDLPAGYAPDALTADATPTLAPDRGAAPLPAGVAVDTFATLNQPVAPIGKVVSGPWDTPRVCVADLDVTAARRDAVPAACSAAQSPNELDAPAACPAMAAAFHAGGDVGEARFECAYDLVTNDVDAPGNRCQGLNAYEYEYRWVDCAQWYLLNPGQLTCYAYDGEPTGPTGECPSGQCVDNQCTPASTEQAERYCLQVVCGTDAITTTRVDHCEQARAATGCEIRNVLGAPTEPATANILLHPDYVSQVDNPDAGERLVMRLSETTVRECVIPEVTRDQDCVGAAMCAPSPSYTEGSRFTAEADLITGDPLCDRGVTLPSVPASLRAFGITLDLNAAVPDIATCADELAQLAELASAPVTDEAQITDDRGCFSPGRWVATFEVLTRALRDGREPDPAAMGLAHRLVQQVAELQALVARDALDGYRQRITFDGDDDARPSLDQLDLSLAAWGFLLDPRVTGALLDMPPEALFAPDPRDAMGVVPSPDASAGMTQGVSISLLSALTEQLDVLDLALERAWLDGSRAAIADREARIAAILRTASVAVPLADALHERALEVGEPAWEAAYQTARLVYVARARGLMERSDAIASGRNPLGIDEVDTPIFFVRDLEGDRERFAAVSSTLVGTGVGDLDAIAPNAVRAAQAALAAARLDWRATEVDAAGSARRQDDIIRRYGELITGYCGAPLNDPNFDVGTYNVLDRPLDVETCFIEPKCRETGDDTAGTLSSADLGYQICVATRAGVAVSGVDQPELAAALDAMATAFSPSPGDHGPFPLTIIGFHRDGLQRSADVIVDGAQLAVPVDELGQIGVSVSAGALGADAASQLLAINADCEASRQATLSTRPRQSPGTCILADDCAVGDKCDEGLCVSVGQADQLDDVGCYYDGAISEQALAVRSAGLEVQAARAELDEYIDRYDIARRGCAMLAASAAEQQALLTAHNNLMLGLGVARTVAASVAHGAAAIASCSSSMAGVDTTTPWGAGVGGGATAVACGALVVQAAAEIAVESLDTVMETAERDHDAAVLRAENDAAQKSCMNEASLEMVGAKAQTLRIRQAQQAQAAAVVNLRGQKSYTAGLWADGNAALMRERRIAEDAAMARFVLSDAAELYLNRFRYAQRLTYLAIRAVEREFQRTEVQARQAVIGAANPDELEEVLTSLAQTVTDGSVGGSQPTGLLAVVSLREHLLQLADLAENAPGEQTLSSEERFRLLLSSPAYAVNDASGTWLGQQIPFSLAPLGAYDLGVNTAGVPIVAQSDCAERLWSVNAAILGGTALFDGSSSSLTRIDLLQRNTFSSQTCSASAASPLDVTTVRPSVNLLKDPGSGTEQNPSPTAVTDYARGLMQPYLNVTRAEFEAEDFSQGSTTQLAGRGLYGDYALFIPAAALSVDGGPGLRLDAVDDILLRFDYVAVAR